jgi:hypothetical protein
LPRTGQIGSSFRYANHDGDDDGTFMISAERKDAADQRYHAHTAQTIAADNVNCQPRFEYELFFQTVQHLILWCLVPTAYRARSQIFP